MKTCEECGGILYKWGCVNCHEEDYILEQEENTNTEKCEKSINGKHRYKFICPENMNDCAYVCQYCSKFLIENNN